MEYTIWSACIATKCHVMTALNRKPVTYLYTAHYGSVVQNEE